MTEENSLPADAALIFIMGMRTRSGTHFLANLLCLHPDCARSPLEEEGFLAHAELLRKYVNRVQMGWTKVMGERNPGDPELLFQSLGNALQTFLNRTKQARRAGSTLRDAPYPARLVARNVRVDNLDCFFRLFPQAHLLLLIRDGRAMVESNVKTFGAAAEAEIRAWAAAARNVAAFLRDPQNAGRPYLLVRYEDLHTETEAEVRRILHFLGLAVARYDFQAALAMPVVGSSSFKLRENQVHWLPVQKTPDFDPLARAAHWSRAQHERFNWLAGAELTELGYTPTTFASQRLYWAAWNRALDFKWAAQQFFQRLLARG